MMIVRKINFLQCNSLYLHWMCNTINRYSPSSAYFFFVFHHQHHSCYRKNLDVIENLPITLYKHGQSMYDTHIDEPWCVYTRYPHTLIHLIPWWSNQLKNERFGLLPPFISVQWIISDSTLIQDTVRPSPSRILMCQAKLKRFFF